MNPVKKRYSLLILSFSLLILYFSGRFIFHQFLYKPSKEDFSILTLDEDKQFSKNPNYMNAVEAYNRKEYGVAIDELKEEIDKNHDHAQAYFLLGVIYEEIKFKEGKYLKEMVSNYEMYIKLKPRGKRVEYAKLRAAQYYVREGLTKQNLKSLDKAENYLKSLDQTNSDVRMALGAIYLDKRDYDHAIAAFEKSANLAPSELKLKYNSLGLAYIKRGSYAKAEKVLEIAVKIDPTYKYAHNNLGFVYAQRGKLEEARQQFSEALTIDPTYKNAEKNLFWVEGEIRKRQ
ncbi:MAG: tetratricopeptide repeat protein [bacterium]